VTPPRGAQTRPLLRKALPPAAKPLGLHKKEPYFDRSELSDLHTAERWRREHWRAVMAGELERPAKVVKKRAMPGAKKAANPELDEMAAVGAARGGRGWGAVAGGAGFAGRSGAGPAVVVVALKRLARYGPRPLAPSLGGDPSIEL
jgi:xeroderma pigmentosum group C-complementing protein